MKSAYDKNSNDSKNTKKATSTTKQKSEIQRLQKEVKRLIKSEADYFNLQQKSEEQFRIYQQLYEVGKTLNNTFSIDEVFKIATNFIIYKLNFGSALWFTRCDEKQFSLCTFDGIYDDEIVNILRQVLIKPSDKLFAPVFSDQGKLECKEGCSDKKLLAFGKSIHLEEFILYPVGGTKENPFCFFLVGNTQGQSKYVTPFQDNIEVITGLSNFVGSLSSIVNNLNSFENLEHSLSLLRATLESTTDGIVVLNQKGYVTGYNQRFIDMWNIPPEIIDSKDSDRLLRFIKERLLHKRRFQIQINRLQEYPDEETFGLLFCKNKKIFESFSLPQKVGENCVGRVWSFRDVTKRIEDEKELHSYRDHLEEQVKARTVDLSTALNDLKKTQKKLAIAHDKAIDANKSKSMFLANMSHEMRTPLNAIIGMTHLVLQTEMTVKQLDYLDKIDFSANALLDSINDILDFSKIEAGKMDLEFVEFNLEAVLRNLSTLVNMKAEEKDIGLYFGISGKVPLWLVGDPLRIGQILLNLVNNAIKFTDSGEILVKIELEQDSDVQDDLLLRFSVKDTGIGISNKQIGKLFRSFSQADTSTTRKYGGTGLGLAICKNLVEMMNGKIWVESQIGSGSNFIFTIRVSLGKKEKERELLTPSKHSRARILLADNNKASEKVLKLYLESFSFQITLPEEGEDIVRILETASNHNPFQLLLLDTEIANIDSIETLKRIKEKKSISTTPIIMMGTSKATKHLLRRIKATDSCYHIVKPVSQSVLFNSVMTALGAFSTEKNNTTPDRINENLSRHKIIGSSILLVEDHEINQQVASELLEQAGFVVTIVVNGKEAVNQFKKESFDAILMDLQMPVMDGHEATRKIRKLEFDMNQKEQSRRSVNGIKTLFHTPIIAMTAHALEEEQEKCSLSGMDDHISKPISPNLLLTTLSKWIKPVKSNIRASKKTKTHMGAKKKLPSNVPGFDIKSGLIQLGGDHELYKELILTFKETHSDAAYKIASYIQKNDYQNALKLIHSIKGIAGNLAAKELYSCSIELEKALQSSDDPTTLPLLNKFKITFEQLLESITALKNSSI